MAVITVTTPETEAKPNCAYSEIVNTELYGMIIDIIDTPLTGAST